MFINITDSETGNNKGSSAALVAYLEKENRLQENKEAPPEQWFNGTSTGISPQEVRVTIDNNIAKLGRNDAKFYLVNISPSQKETAWLKENFGEQGAAQQLKEYAVKVMDAYAANFKRPGIEDNNSLLWYGKLEGFRYYRHNDPEVIQGLRQRGDPKEGEQMHVQIVVSRKDSSNTVKLSPMNNSRGSNAAHSARLGQFDRKAFKQCGESLFDQMYGFERALKDGIDYALTMKNGNPGQKSAMHLLEQYEDKISDTDRQLFLDTAKDISTNDILGPEELMNTLDTALGNIFGVLPSGSLPHEDTGEQSAHFKKKKGKRRPPGI